MIKITQIVKYCLILFKDIGTVINPYLVAEKDINGNYFVWQVDNENDWDVNNQYEILGSIPLNGLGQAIGSLQEQKYTEDDIRKAIAYGYESHHNRVWLDKVYVDSFIASLKK